MIQYTTEPRDIAIKFFIAMLTAFLDCVIPDSSRVNPACIKNTRKPAIVIHNIVRSSLTRADKKVKLIKFIIFIF